MATAPETPWRTPAHARPAGPDTAPPVPGRGDTGRAWLRNAMAALAILAAAAAVVSWDAQYVMVRHVKNTPAIAALEAGIPDVGAVIFAALGIALALHGRRSLRPRTLNVACVAISLTMNAMAAGHGWRDVAIWRMHATGQALAGEEVTPLAVAGACLLWLLRLALAPASTLAGFRRWVVEECPVAPGRKAASPGPPALVPVSPPPASAPRRRRADGKPRKQDLLIALASQRHDLRRLPLYQVARLATQIGAEVDLHQGTARRVLKAHVKAVQDTASSGTGTEARS